MALKVVHGGRIEQVVVHSYWWLENMLTLTGAEIEDLISRVISYSPPHWVKQEDGIRRLEIIGSLLHNSPLLGVRALQVAAGRIGCRSVRLGWDDIRSTSIESIEREVHMFSRAVDVLLTTFIDTDTFGAGQRLVQQLSQSSTSPFINLADYIYAPQSALAVTTALWEHLGGLKGKRIAVSWGFGSTHDLPSPAHSLCLMGASLGADIRVVCPREFPLLSRVIRETQARAKTTEATFEERHDFDSFDDVDAVFAMNWCRLDDFNRPERNSEYASKYRDWHFTNEVLSPESLFIANPPVQTDLLATRALLDSENNITPKLFALMVQAILASISYVIDDKTEHPILI
jgi:ornithine carbamoyltransferase